MHGNGATEESGQQNGAEHRRRWECIERGRNQRDDPDRPREASWDAEFRHALCHEVERHRQDAAIENHEGDHDSADDAAGPNRFARIETGLNCRLHRILLRDAPSACYRSTRIIQLTPKRSFSMPNFGEKKVLVNGSVTSPPSPSALNMRSASASPSAVIASENPSNFGLPLA